MIGGEAEDIGIGADALRMKTVLEVGDVMLLLPLDVVNKSSKDATRPDKARRLSVASVIVQHLKDIAKLTNFV